MKNFKEKVEIAEALPAFYVPYASYVLQTRALCDARDGLKSGARFILYSQYKNKITFKDKRRKGVATLSAAMMYSVHGDAGIYGNAVRMSQPFSYRYPLIDTQGNNGSQMNNNDFAAPRYLEMRSGEIAGEMFSLLKKDTIDKWKLNYTEEEEYPTYLPTLFPNSLVNGNFGIGVSLASSIPTHNLNDVSKALITFLDNPDATFEELYCPIDFPTGGIIVNAEQVKESHRTGKGKAAIVRALIEYDSVNNELVVRELPYMVFSSKALASIQNAIDEGKISGVERLYDGSDISGVKIVIELTKNANPNKITRLLYKHTLLQESFGINMQMLDQGKYPKLFTWQEMISVYVEHLKNIKRKAYLYDLNEIKERIHIIDGLLIAIENIEEVVRIIKTSKTSALAREMLQERYGLSEKQSKAILELKLSRLANLELQKLINEKLALEEKANVIRNILDNEKLFNEEVKKEIIRIQEKYGDERRTKCINLDFTSDDEDAEPIEQKELIIYYTNLNNIYTQESSTLLVTRRGTKGKKLKMEKNEIITKTLVESNFSSLMAFTNTGKMYSCNTDILPINSKINATELFSLEMGERITTLTTLSKKQEIDFFVFTTKKGMIKKTPSSEYANKRSKGIKCINLKEEDEVLNVHFIKDEPVGILTSSGNFVLIETTSINPIGRVAMGVKSVKLSEDETVLSSHVICKKDKTLITLSKKGFIKKTSLSEYPICGRATKGHQIAGVYENDSIIKFLTLSEDCDIIVVTEKGNIKINSSTLSESGRNAKGVKSLTLKDDVNAVDILRE